MYRYIGLIGKQTRKVSLSVTENSPETLPAIKVWPTCLLISEIRLFLGAYRPQDGLFH